MARRHHILLTNDDSHDSPLFLNTIEVLQTKGDLTVVVPAEEQSWKGKSMTRFGPLYVDRIDLHGTPAYSVTGTPADCVNLAVYNLLEKPPDIVVSGINIGTNTGLGFMLASGTVGACLEANIAGIPALALSQALEPAVFRQWHDNRGFLPETATHLKSMSDEIIPLVWDSLIESVGSEPITWNVNFPFARSPELTIVKTKLGQTFYQRCFSKRGDQYFHDLARFSIDPDPESDLAAIRNGNVSVTEIDIRSLGR
jgi:5'-nucleotidase